LHFGLYITLIGVVLYVIDISRKAVVKTVVPAVIKGADNLIKASGLESDEKKRMRFENSVMKEVPPTRKKKSK
jgi:hypothetical protein